MIGRVSQLKFREEQKKHSLLKYPETSLLYRFQMWTKMQITRLEGAEGNT